MSTPQSPGDKQLQGVNLDDVLQRRRLDQALTAKAFAVLLGLSYSTARAWFRLPGFPAIQNVVFWSDFVRWRQLQAGSVVNPTQKAPLSMPASGSATPQTDKLELHGRAAELLSQA